MSLLLAGLASSVPDLRKVVLRASHTLHENFAPPVAVYQSATPKRAAHLATAPASIPTARSAPLRSANHVAIPQSLHPGLAPPQAATHPPARRLHTKPQLLLPTLPGTSRR